MKLTSRMLSRVYLLVTSAALATLVACGGGGGGTAAIPTPAPVTLSGVAATGAAFTDAVVTVIDSTGATVGTSAPVGTDGVFNVTLTAGAKPPFVLIASRTTAEGQVQSLVSVLASPTATVANITPITNLIASLLSPSGDPAKLSTELTAGTAQITPATVAATVQEVQTVLATLLTATGTTNTDPLSGSFAVNGTGYDLLLDSVQISIVPTSTTSSNIEVAVKQQLPDGTQPVTVQFASTATTIPSLPAVNSSTLVASGTSVLISDLLSNLSACYALQLADRVTSGGTTAADIIATACKNVFFGNNPGSFLSNGNVVGRNRAFNGIFTDGGTGVVFSQGTYEFTRNNGDLVIGYKAKDRFNNETFDTFVVRLDTAEGKLKLIGNQYAYPGGVTAAHQLRQFITLNQADYNYYSAGYAIKISDVKGGMGVGGSIFDKVIVTTPGGNTVTLKPSVGSPDLNLVKALSTSASGTRFIRLRSEFANAAVSGDISKMDTSLFFASPQLTNADIAAIPAQSVWKFEYYLVSGVPTTPQYYKTRSRALTIAELKLQGLAQLGAGPISYIQSHPGGFTGSFALPTNGPADGIDFTVPTGALPVTEIKIFGRYFDPIAKTGIGFDDAVQIGSTARTGTIMCTKASSGDNHCSTTVPGAYATGTNGTGVNLFARDASIREYNSFYAAYQLTLPLVP